MLPEKLIEFPEVEFESPLEELCLTLLAIGRLADEGEWPPKQSECQHPPKA